MSIESNTTTGADVLLDSSSFTLIQRSPEDQGYHYFTISPPLNLTSTIDYLDLQVNVTDGNTTWSVVPAGFSITGRMIVRGYRIPLSCNKIDSNCNALLNNYRVEDEAIINYGKSCDNVFTSFASAPERLLRKLSNLCIPAPGNLYAPVFPTSLQYQYSVGDDATYGTVLSSIRVNATDQDGDVIKYYIESASVPGLFSLVNKTGTFQVTSYLRGHTLQTIDLILRATDGYYNATQKLSITITDKTTCPLVNTQRSHYQSYCSSSISSLSTTAVTTDYFVLFNRYSQLKTLSWEWSKVAQTGSQVKSVNRVVISNENGTVIYNETTDQGQSNYIAYVRYAQNGKVSFCNSQILIEAGTKIVIRIAVEINSVGFQFLSPVSSNTTDGVVTLEIFETSTSPACARTYKMFRSTFAIANDRKLNCSSDENSGGHQDPTCFLPNLRGDIAEKSVRLLPDIYKPVFTTVPESVILYNSQNSSVLTDFSWTSALCKFDDTHGVGIDPVEWYTQNGEVLQKSPPIFKASDSGMYYCQGKNFYGTTNSSLVHVELYDEPRFSLSSYQLSVQENSPPGQLVKKFTATSSNFLPIRYYLNDKGSHKRRKREENGSGRSFRMNSTSGELFINDTPDADEQPVISFKVECYLDNLVAYSYPGGTIYPRGRSQVVVNITDLDDNPPQFSQASYTGTISSTAPVGTAVTIQGSGIKASDPDVSSPPIRYSLQNSSQYFQINATSAEITTTTSLLPVQNTSQTLTVETTVGQFQAIVQIRLTVSNLCQDFQLSLDVVLGGVSANPSDLCTSSGSWTVSDTPRDFSVSESWFTSEDTGYDGRGIIFESLTFFQQLSLSATAGKLVSRFIYDGGEGKPTIYSPTMEYSLQRENNSSVWKISPPIISYGSDAAHDIIFDIFLTMNGTEVKIGSDKKPFQFNGDYVYMTCGVLDKDPNGNCRANLTAYKTLKTAGSQVGINCYESTSNSSESVLSFLRNLTRDCIVLPTEVAMHTPKASVLSPSTVAPTPFNCRYTEENLVPIVLETTSQNGSTVLQCALKGKEGTILKSDDETVVKWNLLNWEKLLDPELEGNISFTVDSESRVTFPQFVIRGQYRCCMSCSKNSNASACSVLTVVNPRDVKLFRAKLTFRLSPLNNFSITEQQLDLALTRTANISSLKSVTILSRDTRSLGVKTFNVYLEIYSGRRDVTAATLTTIIEQALNSSTSIASGIGGIISVVVYRIDACESISETTSYGNFTWPDVPSGSVDAVSCPPPRNSSIAFKRCNDSFGVLLTGPEWGQTNTTGCKYSDNFSNTLNFLTEVKINDETVLPVVQSAKLATRNGENLRKIDVISVSTIADNVAEGLGSFEREVVENFVEMVSNTLDANNTIVLQSQLKQKASTKILLAVEKIVSLATLPLKAGSFSFARRNFGIEVYDPSTVLTDGVTFAGFSFGSKKPSGTGSPSADDQLSDDQLFRKQGPVGQSADGKFEVLLQLPADLFGSGANSTRMERLHFFIYQNGKLFETDDNDTVNSAEGESVGDKNMMKHKKLNTRVIGSSVGVRKRTELSSQVMVQFAAFNDSDSNASCVYWDIVGSDGYGEWSSEGCTVVESESGNYTCNCTHLTNFAVLVDPYEGKGIDPANALALSIISYIGCCVSLIGLLLTVFTYIATKSLRKQKPGKILINLCFAMIFGLLFFIIYGVNRGNNNMCTATAFLLHYFWLASLCWMGVEAVNMYLSLVRVLGSHVHHFVLKAGLVAWGLPLIVLAITAGVDYKDAYKKVFKESVCRVSVPAFYGAFYGVLGATLVFNFVVFLMVMRALSQRAKTLGRAKKKKKQSNLRMAVAISLLLGFNWIFAVWATNDKADDTVRLVFNYLFAFTASFQGFLIFIFYCVLRDEVKKSWKRLFCGRSSSDFSPANKGRILASPNSQTSILSKNASGREKTTNSIELTEKERVLSSSTLSEYLPVDSNSDTLSGNSTVSPLDVKLNANEKRVKSIIFDFPVEDSNI